VITKFWWLEWHWIGLSFLIAMAPLLLHLDVSVYG